jgi:predicted DsbA family dithiol-disulfide isomerase
MRWQERPVRVDIWSDLVCPWCYVGKRRFERALAAFAHRDDVLVAYRAFQLDPRSPRGTSTPRRQVLMAKYRLSGAQADEMDERMLRTAAAEGLDYHLSGGVTGNTFDAHQIVQMGARHDRQDAVIERLFHAHFTEQRSLFEHESLAQLATEAGLDGDEAREALRADTYAGGVASDVEAAKKIGITGVPFFLIDGRYGVSGAQPPDALNQVLERAWTEAHR